MKYYAQLCGFGVLYQRFRSGFVDFRSGTVTFCFLVDVGLSFI